MKIKQLITFIGVSFLIIAVASSAISAMENITISGGTIGGGSHLMANGVAIIARNYCGLSPTVVINPAQSQVDVVQAGDADISTAVGYHTFYAYNGLDRWKDNPFPEARSFAERPENMMQIVVLNESPIQKFSDLIGKRVVVGKQGMNAAMLGEVMFSALGIEYDKDVTPLYIGHADAVAALIAGKVDAYLVCAAFPQASVIEISEIAKGGIRLVPLSEEEVKIIGEKTIIFNPRIVPPTYKGMEEEILTVGIPNVFVCRNDLPEEVAYNLTKAFYELLDVAALQSDALSHLKLENISLISGVAPWHMGSYRYYKEMGLEIPPEMVPPEAK
ncbi:MAG: TAXI family TRAP transporter solute-binding subunit [Nitrososphaeraceae archaeon]|nr:TAXI family TRAP transporter solute-binding subunit [Nitrososphaeraceae archaeon]